MKYLSLILVVAFLQLTWCFSQQKRDLTVSQHNKITTLIRQYMTQAVKSKEPGASDIEFSSIYTEIVEEGKKMKAHFKFSYMQPSENSEASRVQRKGSFFITSEDGKDWRAQVEEVNDVQVQFIEAQSISPGDSATEPAESQPAETSHEEDHSH